MCDMTNFGVERKGRYKKKNKNKKNHSGGNKSGLFSCPAITDTLSNFCFDNLAYKADKFFAHRLGVT